jgi:hypothetical protein
MASLTMSVTMERRAAVVTTNNYWEKAKGIAAGPHKCFVLGLFQYSNGDDEVYPIFVVELEDGSVIEVGTETVRFVDTIQEGSFKND